MSSQGDGAAPMTVDLTEAAEGADVPQAPTDGPFRKGELVGREETFTLRYVHPKGGVREVDLVSRVMDRPERDRYERLVASQTAGLPLACFPENGFRLMATYRMAVQLVKPPKWLLEAASEDDNLLRAIAGFMGAHSDRYFCGDDGEGGAVAFPTHVELVPHSEPLRKALEA